MVGSKMIQFLIFITLFFFNYSFASHNPIPSDSFNVVEHKRETDSDWTRAFIRTWEAACESNKEHVTIYVPQGIYLLTHVEFKGEDCKYEAIDFVIDGTLMAPADYSALQDQDNWLLFNKVNGLSILGGTIDGQGTNLWESKKSDDNNHPKGVTSLGIYDSKNVVIDGLISHNSQMFHIVVYECENVHFNNIYINAPEDSPNTDGIHLQQSSGVSIWNSIIRTGDDCISMVKGTTDVWIENVICGPGHGISIGSLGKRETEEGVRNITVKNATLSNTQNGVRIKAWSKTSTSFADKVLFQDIFMDNVDNPIMVTTNYCPDNDCHSKDQSTVHITNIEFQNIHGVSATEVAMTIECPGQSVNLCDNIILDEVELSYNGDDHAKASCINADVHFLNHVEPKCY